MFLNVLVAVITLSQTKNDYWYYFTLSLRHEFSPYNTFIFWWPSRKFWIKHIKKFLCYILFLSYTIYLETRMIYNHYLNMQKFSIRTEKNILWPSQKKGFARCVKVRYYVYFWKKGLSWLLRNERFCRL